ncbi:TetR/AcrR family transcriptional regulator [Burkholderia glumae]|uniref:TetR/AcrR family transcriptional regulator n=1 Tax=Burkholderia glumae TaxID=337 RepID=A0AAP9XXG4_BURGL|nr:TetR/AcrR family transcriptional regulator [Burkholderia glumae]AJY62837.1 bacterial regulatory s, tetR family protein [Burkholderia glumae LMG 2196 = ATCC 33617]KHJ62590.1 TetR family transcriptional regulator [Burkholderia glumae]MCM2485317.1 TetR/AcrR family transcriptional regulator [Burkholderia glumae]MCM2495670.1 TetR/AcrR family transcriptional regulator [Burkholderia glumae]MCM2511012.1 TetR/AcrR family transcriptional regulator [Burkholderia glumae]
MTSSPVKSERADGSRAPAGRKSQQRVQEILRAGREVFAEKGYEHATAAEIAQRVGVSEATVFSYFRGKRELCARVIADWYDENIATFEAGLPALAPVREQFAFIVRTHLRLMLVNGTGLCALVLSEGRARQEMLGDELSALQRRYTAPLMKVLARGQAQGQVRADLPLSLLRSLVFGPIEHVLWDAILGRRELDAERTAEQLIGVLWAALQPPAPDVAALAQFERDVREALGRVAGAAGAR